SALLLPDSVPRQAFDKALDQATILISTPVMLELAEVLTREKLDQYLIEQQRLRFLVGLLKETDLVDISGQIDACRDPKDNKFLELAVSGNADFLISGDNDLLVLNPFRKVAILTPRQFLNFTLHRPPSR